MAAVAGVQLAHDLVALELLACRQHRWQAQLGALVLHLAGVGRGHAVDGDDLYRAVVRAAVLQGLLHDAACSGVQVGGMRGNGLHDGTGRHVLVHAVGAQHKHVARVHRQTAVIDLGLGLHAQRAAQVAAPVGHAHAVVFGELLQCAALHAVDARIAHMEQVRRGPFDDERAERADVAPVLVEAVGAAPRLRMQPRVGGCHHALG